MKRYIATPYSLLLFLFDALETVLLARFVFVLFGANSANWFVRALYGLTEPLVAPFRSIFSQSSVNGFTFEWGTLIAMAIYGLIAALAFRLLFTIANPHEETIVHHEETHLHA